MSERKQLIEPDVSLPEGVTVGHSSDREGWTGCTVILGPEDSVSAGEIRGGGPATHEFGLLSPATSTPGAHAVLLSGGSAFGLGATAGVVEWMRERGRGYPTPAGPVPLVSGAACFDLPVGSAEAWPGPEDAREACDSASERFERGSVGERCCPTAAGPRPGWGPRRFGSAKPL